MQELEAYEEVEHEQPPVKDGKKASRILKSQSARSRRREVKEVKEVKEQSLWLKGRRQRKHLQKIKSRRLHGA
jgi:hypothetical protein